MQRPTYKIELRTLNDFTVLPRVSMQFSRRRIKIDHFEMLDVSDQNLACFTITISCNGEIAHSLVKQLHKLIELRDVSISVCETSNRPVSRPAAEPICALAEAALDR